LLLPVIYPEWFAEDYSSFIQIPLFMGTLACNHLHIARKGQLLECTVILGSPGRDCQGHGICMVLPNKFSGNIQCTSVPAELIFSEGRVQLNIKRMDLTEAMIRKYFSGNEFLMESDFYFPRWVVRRLNLASYAYIPVNKYKIEETKKQFSVYLFLKSKSREVIFQYPG
jgi:hypothetical protein